MTIIGIDPSYSRTGICVYRTADDFEVYSIEGYGLNEQSVIIAMYHAYQIASEVRKVILSCDEDYVIACEYPIMATRAGAYLGFITSKLDSLFRSLNCKDVILIPSVACNAFTRAKNKQEIIRFLKSGSFCPDFKGNHDEATAVVLAEIGSQIMADSYKKSFFRKNYSEE